MENAVGEVDHPVVGQSDGHESPFTTNVVVLDFPFAALLVEPCP